MMKTIKAVIFDMDGLMFDTERIYIELLEKTCIEHNIAFPKSCLHQMIGVSSVAAEDFEKDYPGILEVIDEVDRIFDDYFYQTFPNKGDANKKGLKELFAYLKTNGYKTAVASSSRKRHILNLISYSGLDLDFDVILSSFSDYPSKPAPDVFLAAAKQLGIEPDKCMVLEDSKYGTMAAYRAGMHRVLIPDMLEPDEELKTYIEFKADSLLDVIDILKDQ